MGLIRAAIGSFSGVMADQWKEFIYCDALPPNILVAKGMNRLNGRSVNYKGDPNVISNGSVIAVADGQCMIIVDQGAIVEFCAIPGEFVYDTSSEPSMFFGGLGAGLINSFKQVGRRIGFGGGTGKDQRVYYINTKEISGNKYGTPSPIPFRIYDGNIGLDIDISLRCNGEYSYKIVDPLLFYRNVCSNVSESYDRTQIESMLRTELLTALQPAFAAFSPKGIRPSALPGLTMEIADELNEILSSKWAELRGIKIVSFGMNSVTIPPEDEKLIKDLQRTAVMRDPGMAAATLTSSQADAMRTAAGNSGGVMAGFMGMNIAQMQGGMNANQLYGMHQQNIQQQAQNNANQSGWKCSCGTQNTGKFCMECGNPPVQGNVWTCSCGVKNTGKFCMECGKQPAGDWTCSCGAKNLGKFCMECGKPR